MNPAVACASLTSMSWYDRPMNPLVALALLIGLGCAYGCPNEATTARECESNTSRCEAGRPQVCLSTGRWRATDALEPCPATTACCLIQGVEGRPIHACALPDQCLSEGTTQPTYAPPSAGDSQ